MQPTAEQDLIEARELLKKQLLVENAGWPWIAAEIAELATAVGVLQLPRKRHSTLRQRLRHCAD